MNESAGTIERLRVIIRLRFFILTESGLADVEVGAIEFE
jgi:hypothetical protein